MYRSHMHQSMMACAVFVALLIGSGGSVARAGDDTFEQGIAALEAQNWSEAIRLLRAEIEANPGHELAYIRLATALEKNSDDEGAHEVWSTLLEIADEEVVQREARKAFLRTKTQVNIPWTQEDLFHVPDVDVDYRRLLEVHDDEYENSFPPVWKETKHFTVFSCNYELTNTLADLCESYLEFLLERFLDGRAWSQRVPILCYKNIDDYVKVGGNPEGSLGVTWSSQGRTMRIAIFQISDEDEMEFQKVDHPVEGNIEDTLPHELVHMVLFEFFGNQKNPRWLHEGCARQMEQLRDDPVETADIARDVVAGEWLRFRDFWDLEAYPTGGQTLRFYDQSATIVWFLFSHGPEAFRAFLDEVVLGTGWDAAAAAALGIPQENAVEEFERRWALWMRDRYVKDLEEDDPDAFEEAVFEEKPLFLPGVALEPTLERVEEWTDEEFQSLNDFRNIEDSRRYWKVQSGKLICTPPKRGSSLTLLGTKVYQDLPLVVQCKVRRTGQMGRSEAYFGFSQLDLAGDEIGVQVLATLDDRQTHDITCVLASDLTLYVDGRCVGRYPAVMPRADQDESDYPLAFAASTSLEVWDARNATLSEVVLVGAPEDEEEPQRGRQGRGGRSR